MILNLWTADEIALLTELYPDLRAREISDRLPGRSKSQVQGKAWSLGLRKTPETIARLSRESATDINHGGRKHLFTPGCAAWNKGLSYAPGGRCAETQFKSGNMSGRAQINCKPIGYERMNKDGYRERKIHDGLPRQSRWRSVHILLWESVYGPLPANHCVIFRDRDRGNITLENLELITRAEMMRRNTVHNYGKEIAAVVQLRGAITRKLNRSMKNV